jgi:serine/threonine-protein kinase
MHALAFDANTLQTHGQPVPINERIFTPTFGNVPDFDVSNNGTLVYVRDDAPATARTVVWVNRDGSEEPTQLPVRAYTYPAISPDGKHAAFDIRDEENDIWIWDFARNNLRRLTFDPAFNQYAVWTPDSSRIVYFLSNSISRRDIAGTGGGLFWTPFDGTGTPEGLLHESDTKAPNAISPDGKLLVFRETRPGTEHDLMVLRLDETRKVEPLIQTNASELNADISPDGRWIAYESDESGSSQVYVRPFPNVNTGRWQVSTGGGVKPLWSRNGKELFYLGPNQAMMAVAIESGTTFEFATPVKLFNGHYFTGSGTSIGRTYDVSPDGRRFLMIKPAPGSTSMIVVQNWFKTLRLP